MINISLPDGSVRSFDKPVSGAEIAASIGPGLAKAALALRVDGKMVDLAHVVDCDARIGIVTSKDPAALELLRHDAAHVLAQAVQELFPGTQITFGPATEDGFYYDELVVSDQPSIPLRIRSLVGVIPLLAVEVLDQRVIDRLPGFKARLEWFLRTRTDLARHVSYIVPDRVVDGYGWPLTGLFDQNWQKMTKFRVEPGFYNAEVSLVVNLDVWKKLNPKQRELLQKHMLELEADNTAYWKKNSEDEIKRQDQAGIQVIKFDPTTAKQYLDKAYDSGWAGVIKNSPEYGPKLKQALTK